MSTRAEIARDLAETALKLLKEGADTTEVTEEFGRWALASLTDAERRELAERMEKKQVVDRFVALTDILIELANGDKRLVAGALDQRVREFHEIIEHVRGLWRDARAAFRAGRYGTATFLAIACSEEVGKAGVAKLQVIMPKPAATIPTPPTPRRGPLYSHTKKHLLVAGQGALINARLDRLLGLERVVEFLDDVETNRIEDLRQSALYSDHDGTTSVLPEKSITRDQALFYVILAGEMMAEVLGAEPEVWRVLLDEVIEFEREEGNALADDQLDPSTRV